MRISDWSSDVCSSDLAGRVIIDVRYGANPDGLPSRLVIKLARDDKIMGSMYANEVAFYRRIRPELSIEAPACFGGNYDEDRSEERRVGKECDSTCRTRRAPIH